MSQATPEPSSPSSPCSSTDCGSRPGGCCRRLSVHWSGWLAVPVFAAAGFLTSNSFARIQGQSAAHAALHITVNLGAGLAIALAVSGIVARLCRARNSPRTVTSAATLAFVASLAFVSTVVSVVALVAVTRGGPVSVGRQVVHRTTVERAQTVAGADTGAATR